MLSEQGWKEVHLSWCSAQVDAADERKEVPDGKKKKNSLEPAFSVELKFASSLDF